MNKQIQGNITDDQIENSKPQFTEQVTLDSVNAPVRFSPVRFFSFTIGGIFLAEVFAMIIVYSFQDLPYYLQTLIDASVMILMIFPLIYFFSLKPLLVHIEKQQRMEESLRQSEERFAKAFHSSPAALSISRVVDGGFIDVNESFLQLSEYNREEVIGRTSIELGMYVNPDERTEITRQMLSRQGVRGYEMAARTKSGEILNVLISTEGIELAGEACILSSISDITERLRAEQAVETERHRFNNILESLPVYVVLLTPDYQVPFANRVFRERFGECHGKCCYEHLFGRTEPCEICGTYKVLNTMAPNRWEWNGPDGRIYDVFDYPFTDTDGSTLILEMGIDITEQKHAEEANRQLSRIVEQTEDTVVVTNRDGIIDYVNPAFEHQTGYTKEEALGKTPRVIKSGDHDGDFYRNLWDTILRGDVFQSEIANRRKNGELFYEVKTITPLRDAEGNITHFVATGKDITQHKLDEEKLLKAYDELELRVQERTEELKIANSELEDEINIRQRTEDALRQSEHRLKRAQEIAHLGSWELDLVNSQLTWSDEVYRIFGLQPQEFGATYEAFLEAVHPDDRAMVDNTYSGSIREGRDNYEIEHRIVKRSNGEVRIVHEKCEHFRDEERQIVRSVGMVHDITERKQAEETLRRSEALLVQTGEMAKVGGWELDLQMMTLHWSPETYHIHEVDPSFKPDLENAINYYTPEARPIIRDAVQQAIEAGQSYDLELPFVTAKGRPIWIRTIGQPEFCDGKCVRLFGTFQDITERRHAEEALRAARDELELRVQERTQELEIANRELLKVIVERIEVERQLRIQTTAMEAAANGIVITDYQGNIQWTNPALTQISGYDTSDLIGQSMRIFKSGQHDSNYYHKMWNTILSGQVWRGEMTNRRKDGSMYVEEQTITPVRDEDGKIPHFIAIKQDITKRKQAEQELEQRNLELQTLSNAEHKQRQLAEALVQATLILNKSLNLDEVLAHILEQIREVIPYQLANITLIEGDTFYDASHQGDSRLLETLASAKNRFPIHNFPLIEEMIRTNQPVLIQNTKREPNWITVQGLDWSRSFLSAPLLVEEKVIGFVNLFGDQPGFFTGQMRDQLAAFAAHAAAAIQNAWLFEQVRASSEHLHSLSRRLVEVQESERLYISRELHDEAGQILTSMMLDLRLLEKEASHPEVVVNQVSKMEESLNEVLENLHRVAMALRPASLDHLGLVAALRQHVESMGEKHGLKVSFRSGKVQNRLPANVETVLYRIVQEALTNVVRHAHASRVDVALTVRDNQLVVIVEDDGIGFDPETVSTDDHLGLFGMRERAEMINGKLMVESAPGKGTTIMLEVGYADTNLNRG